jgi:hypothetical protein
MRFPEAANMPSARNRRPGQRIRVALTLWLLASLAHVHLKRIRAIAHIKPNAANRRSPIPKRAAPAARPARSAPGF